MKRGGGGAFPPGAEETPLPRAGRPSAGKVESRGGPSSAPQSPPAALPGGERRPWGPEPGFTGGGSDPGAAFPQGTSAARPCRWPPALV